MSVSSRVSFPIDLCWPVVESLFDGYGYLLYKYKVSNITMVQGYWKQKKKKKKEELCLEQLIRNDSNNR